mmetsp:Transcript_6771/g.11848  ORF Transcript_6771/g.11848 Transcript_6771/m.11848 type:complete len:83 (-) Transcript_6771:188-436(-)
MGLFVLSSNACSVVDSSIHPTSATLSNLSSLDTSLTFHFHPRNQWADKQRFFSHYPILSTHHDKLKSMGNAPTSSTAVVPFF